MVNVNVKFSVMFKDLTGTSATEADIDGSTVGDLVKGLIDQYGEEFEKRVVDEETGAPRRFINIFVNGRDIRNLEGPDTKLDDGDEVRMIPAVAGGKGEFGFTEDQIVRYSRQIVLPEVGGRGQRKLLDSSVLIVGAGGLGSPAILYLAAAGIGEIGIVDDDGVELSNLQRQVIHQLDDIGKPKVDSAEEAIREINPEIEVKTYEKRLGPENVFDIVEGWDMVLDGSDNFPTKFLVNDACVIRGTPFSHAGILRFVGMCSTILPRESPCFRCFTPEAPPEGAVPSCQEAGVLGSIPGVIGSVQASEVIKYLLDIGDLLTGRMLYFDASEMRFSEFEFKRNPECPACGEDPGITDLSKVDYGHVCEVRF